MRLIEQGTYKLGTTQISQKTDTVTMICSNGPSTTNAITKYPSRKNPITGPSTAAGTRACT